MCHAYKIFDKVKSRVYVLQSDLIDVSGGRAAGIK